MKKFLLAVLVSSLAACSTTTGFDRGALHSQLQQPQVINDDDIKQALAVKPQLAAPFRVAVYFSRPGSQAGGSWSAKGWRWSAADKQQFLKLRDGLKAQGVVSDLFLLSDNLVDGQDHKSLRLAAARAGADAVLVVDGVSQVERHLNHWGLSYILLVPALFVPGTQLDGLFVSNATLWDVRNDYLYLSSESEGTARQVRSTYGLDEDELMKQAKADSLGGLGKEVNQRLLALTGK